jgi:hypothetical protein
MAQEKSHETSYFRVKQNHRTQRNILCLLFTTSTYTLCFGPSWWPSSSVITIIYKRQSLLPTDPFESGLVSMINLHNIKLYVITNTNYFRIKRNIIRFIFINVFKSVFLSTTSLNCVQKYEICWDGSWSDRLCGLVVRVLGYRSGGPCSIPGTTRKKVVGLERGPFSLVSTTEELLGRKVAVPV